MCFPRCSALLYAEPTARSGDEASPPGSTGIALTRVSNSLSSPEIARSIARRSWKGKNALLLKIANGNHPHGFYFTLLAGQEIKTVK